MSRLFEEYMKHKRKKVCPVCGGNKFDISYTSEIDCSGRREKNKKLTKVTCLQCRYTQKLPQVAGKIQSRVEAHETGYHGYNYYGERFMPKFYLTSEAGRKRVMIMYDKRNDRLIVTSPQFNFCDVKHFDERVKAASENRRLRLIAYKPSYEILIPAPFVKELKKKRKEFMSHIMLEKLKGGK